MPRGDRSCGDRLQQFADVIIVFSIEPAASCRDVEGTSTADSIAIDSKSSGSKVLLTVAG